MRFLGAIIFALCFIAVTVFLWYRKLTWRRRTLWPSSGEPSFLDEVEMGWRKRLARWTVTGIVVTMLVSGLLMFGCGDQVKAWVFHEHPEFAPKDSARTPIIAQGSPSPPSGEDTSVRAKRADTSVSADTTGSAKPGVNGPKTIAKGAVTAVTKRPKSNRPTRLKGKDSQTPTRMKTWSKPTPAGDRYYVRAVWNPQSANTVACLTELFYEVLDNNNSLEDERRIMSARQDRVVYWHTVDWAEVMAASIRGCGARATFVTP
jgi:hypothetical protein